MKFQPTANKDSVRVRFIEGTLTKFIESQGVYELHLGTGPLPKNSTTFPRRKLVLLMRKVVYTAKQNQISSIEVDWTDVRALASDELSDFELGDMAGTSFMMAGYEHNTYKQAPKSGFTAVKIVAITNTSKTGQEGIERGYTIAQEVNACRELCNTPGGDMTPKVLAKAAKAAVAGTKATFKTLGLKEMTKLGMGAVIGMAKGSTEEPQFIMVEYWGAGKPNKRSQTALKVTQSDYVSPIVLVGKGVTFDTGGLNIKTGDHMYEMHMDMTGGATVIHAVALAAKLKLKTNVIGLVPAIENMAGNGAVRPGDILKSLSGKTIEILNTDAEGRVILADGVTYAQKYNPAAIVDVATLTGASLVAIGTQASGFMTNDESKIPEIMALAEKSGDYMWPFPAWEEYEAMTKGTFGDIPNLSSDGNSRDGGLIAGGMFIREFLKDFEGLWIHIDMAPRMIARSDEFLAKGAVGDPVRFLLALAESYSK